MAGRRKGVQLKLHSRGSAEIPVAKACLEGAKKYICLTNQMI